jgi:hypothetical protein
VRFVVTFPFALLLLCVFALSPALAGDWPEGLAAKPRFSKLAEAAVVTWTVTNVSDKPFAPGTVPVHYACADGETDVVNHFFPSSIMPGASESDGDHFLCVGRGPVVSLAVQSLEGGTSAGSSLIYLMPCNRGATTQLELTWNDKGFYDFETEDGVKGVVARAVLDDETLMKTACTEFGPPQGQPLQNVRDWFGKWVFSRAGDRKQGYTGIRN